MRSLLTVLAAGSLRRAFVPLLERFHQQTGIAINTCYGPAGLLRERIEAGERCAVFASANTQHPQTLFSAGRAIALHTFARNALCLTVRRSEQTDNADWLALLTDPALRLATSTPGCDPSGDYTWQLFDNIERDAPGEGDALKARAQMLVGGRESLSLPQGEIASAWLIQQGLADLFIGYAHYSSALRNNTDVRVVAIPEPWNVRCDYQLAQTEASPQAAQLCEYILSDEGQSFLRNAGFLSVTV